MLSIDKPEDIVKMKKYHFAGDMANLLMYFPEVSSIRDLTILENVDEYYLGSDFFNKLKYRYVDSLKTRKFVTGIDTCIRSGTNRLAELLTEVKEQDPLGVITLFNTATNFDKCYASISLGVDLGKSVYIRVFDKNCFAKDSNQLLETYLIPWEELRKCTVGNFNTYRTYLTDKLFDYEVFRDYTDFLDSVSKYCQLASGENTSIPYFIWCDIITNLLKRFEKNEDILDNDGITSFEITGCTNGRQFTPWIMTDKTGYAKTRKKF